MQTKREGLDLGMMLLPSLEEFIPRDHYLRRLNSVLDLSFVHEAVRDRYCQDNGRPSVDPEVVLRLFLLQAIENIPSVRKLMERVHVDLSYRWFIGYRVDEKLPDHSTLSKALDRLGDEVFNQLFEGSISQCQRSGLIEGKVLHVDATTIRADIDANRVNKPTSSDQDARFGKFPGKRMAPGYKQHTVADGRARVVLGLSVTPANHHEHDEAVALVDRVLRRLEKPPDAVCADAAYASGRNYVELAERGIRLVSPPPKAKTYTGDAYFTVEDFEYNEANDMFVCPAGNQLKYVSTEKERGRRNYRAKRSDCRVCPLKTQCTRAERRSIKVSPHHGGLVQLRTDSKTEDFKELYASRAPVIEGVFGEAKQWHGLRRAWRRGLSKMRVQCLLTAAVINLKRLVAVFGALFGLRLPIKTIIETIRLILTASDDKNSQSVPRLIDI